MCGGWGMTPEVDVGKYLGGIEPPQTGHEPIMLPLHHRYHLVWQMVVHLVVADGGLYGELDVVLDCGE